ncbi:MAG: hypothetical protein SGILL_004448 [Bacillariaceae sp.]
MTCPSTGRIAKAWKRPKQLPQPPVSINYPSAARLVLDTDDSPIPSAATDEQIQTLQAWGYQTSLLGGIPKNIASTLIDLGEKGVPKSWLQYDFLCMQVSPPSKPDQYCQPCNDTGEQEESRQQEEEEIETEVGDPGEQEESPEHMKEEDRNLCSLCDPCRPKKYRDQATIAAGPNEPCLGLGGKGCPKGNRMRIGSSLCPDCQKKKYRDQAKKRRENNGYPRLYR